ncbi:hypothetical protein [Paenibacillus beijingensis]|uniref:Uncharacterized protein n=1 Tax=Paenibacillus beijingensis TaxID=1126833 RepID=A0A0D5NP98_9BACL|nr:hypothetical protein [Paenibacillus beijingensis]AJY76733.1 hypothetical protein VN24_21890 [Paenibacillus beijingensis]
MEEKSVDYHLQQATVHLEAALSKSISHVIDHQQDKKMIGGKWEQFLGQFIGLVREKGKQSKVNVLSWITFPRLR